MELTGSDWMERYAIHTGEFWSDEIYAIIETMLNEGSSFVDIGANVGFVTLCAARAVGMSGRVFSFEPNVVLVGRLRRMLEHNHIANVTLFPYAAGDVTGEIGFTNDRHHGGIMWWPIVPRRLSWCRCDVSMTCWKGICLAAML